MSPQERKAEFDRLFESIPGKNTDRIKKVCEILHCKEITVRIYRMASPTRYPPESKVKILADRLASQQVDSK